jgi:hypothetical protein
LVVKSAYLWFQRELLFRDRVGLLQISSMALTVLVVMQSQVFLSILMVFKPHIGQNSFLCHHYAYFARFSAENT